MNTNNFGLKFFRYFKNKVVPKGRYKYRVPIGLYKGLVLQLDLSRKFQLYLGLFEQETSVFIRKSMGADVFIDIGASGGELCALFAKVPNTRVVAIEPTQGEADLINEQVVGNIHQGNHFSIITNFCGTKESYVQLDGIEVKEFESAFIKIDVEACELDVLLSGRELLLSRNCTLLVETHSIELEKDCIAFLNTLGYSCKVIKNAWWRIFVPETRHIPHCRWFHATKNS